MYADSVITVTKKLVVKLANKIIFTKLSLSLQSLQHSQRWNPS